jgi:perosamine synthetase
MRQLSGRLVRKKEIWMHYKEELTGVAEINLFEHDLKYCSPWFIDCHVLNRDALADHLKNIGVGTRTMYPPINRQKAYSLEGTYPVSESVGSNGLWLPSMIQLSDDQIKFICGKIRNFYRC